MNTRKPITCPGPIQSFFENYETICPAVYEIFLNNLIHAQCRIVRVTLFFKKEFIDYYNDWPMATEQFERYVKSKYDDIDAIHHYEYAQESGSTTFTIELPNDSATTIPVGATPITNYEYEESIQENKRRIRLIQKRFIGQIKNEFKNQMNG